MVNKREKQMRSVTLDRYGSPDVLSFDEIQKPTPKNDEVLINVYATSVNAGDWHLLRGDPYLIRLSYGLRRPKVKVLGADVAGRVEAVGRDVTQFRPGDEVYGDVSPSGFGAFAEYVVAPESILALKPANLTFEQAAAVPSAAVTALQGLRDHGKLQPGQRVLINGASGGVGTYAVQIAKAFGAEVTAVCSTAKADMVRSIGADHVIDYTQEDFTKNGQHYDLILAVGGALSLFDYKRSLTPAGHFVMIGGSSTSTLFQTMFLGSWISRSEGQTMSLMLVKPNHADLAYVGEMLESGKVRPVIDRHYALSDVPDAIRYMEAGHAQGKVVINVAQEDAGQTSVTKMPAV